MKSINARTTLKLVLALFWFVALVVVRLGYAGEYYIYHDPNGKLVISNYAPPQGSNVIKKETLSEVTDQQIIESQLRENRLALDNRLSNLEKNVSELTENLRTQSEVITNMPEGYGDTNITVGVVQGPAIVGRPPHKNFNHPEKFAAQFTQSPASPCSARVAFRWWREGRVKLCLFLIPATYLRTFFRHRPESQPCSRREGFSEPPDTRIGAR